MKDLIKYYLIKSATLTGIFIGVLAYWFQPYNQTTLFGVNIWLIMGIGAFLGALVLMTFLTGKPIKTALLIVLGVVIAVLARILYDTLLWDPTSHNLAPFEILWAVFATAPGAFSGAFLGLLIKKTQKYFDSSHESK